MKRILHYFLQRYSGILILVVLIAFHLTLINKTFSQDSFGNLRAASAGYGDIPFHMTQVSKFAFQKELDFNEPLFDGERLRYAFGINLISGIILRYTGNWTLAMHLPAMTFMTLGTVLVFLSYRSFLRSQFGAACAIVIFLLGAGFGTSYLIEDYANRSTRLSENFFEYLVSTTASTATKWDAVYPRQNIAWGSPLSLVFLHQRAFFLGFFMFSVFWYLLWNWVKNSHKYTSVILLGLIVGLTPLAHYHSFVAMLVVLSVTGLYVFTQGKRKALIGLIMAGIIIVVLATPQILYLTQGKTNLLVSQDSFIQFRLGWMNDPTIGSIQYSPDSTSVITGRFIPFLNFLWINFGVVLPAFLFGLFIFIMSKKFKDSFRDVSILLISGGLLFLLVQFVRFQPWDYDNNKILVYFQFFAAPITIAFFKWISFYKKALGYILLIAFTIIAIHSGIVDQIPRFSVPTYNTPVIFNNDAISLADFVKEYIPEDKKIITTSTHLNPVASLTGRPVYVGYPGWLWTRGLNYGQREEHLKAFYTNPQLDVKDFYISQAEYVLLDPTSIYDWHAPKEKFDEEFNRIFSNDSYSFYKIR